MSILATGTGDEVPKVGTGADSSAGNTQRQALVLGAYVNDKCGCFCVCVCECVCVCVCACMHFCVCICLCVHLSVCACLCVYTYMHACVCVQACVKASHFLVSLKPQNFVGSNKSLC